MFNLHSARIFIEFEERKPPDNDRIELEIRNKQFNEGVWSLLPKTGTIGYLLVQGIIRLGICGLSQITPPSDLHRDGILELGK